ncbi:Kynurenine formamidase [Natronincola peptidivorans]|uniref:Kynurenine formamidase n=1 Tax=Natronincola peptidivorans TaxID=426128 RepID=A0A1I0GZ16_9FIRM|nr:cyclase family protein [Natronincola peptidivorans]SET76491.1 Kynurenine formamidase [Natronincola peptidivorans]
MKIIDLTQMMHADMPVFPGTEKPIFYPANTLEKDGFIETKLSLYSHTGTHIDAPGHMLLGGKLLNQLEISHFIGKATVLDVSTMEKKEISKEDLLKYEDKIKDLDYLILKTGWSKYWGEEKYFDGFPSLTVEAAAWLTGFNLKGIGIDTISIDDMKTTTFPNHYKLFENNMIVIENLTNLDLIKEEIFIFSCFPLNYENADGSPVRAIAMENVN